MYDVIVFTETWHNDSVFNKYKIYSYNRNTRRGSGLLVTVASIYPSKQFVIRTSNIEFVVVKLKTSNVNFSCS